VRAAKCVDFGAASFEMAFAERPGDDGAPLRVASLWRLCDLGLVAVRDGLVIPAVTGWR